jgi:hypothetical protein
MSAPGPISRPKDSPPDGPNTATGSPAWPQRVRYDTFAELDDGDVVFTFWDAVAQERRISSPIRDIIKLNWAQCDAPGLAWYRVETLSRSYYATLMPRKHVAEIVAALSRTTRAAGSETRIAGDGRA